MSPAAYNQISKIVDYMYSTNPFRWKPKYNIVFSFMRSWCSDYRRAKNIVFKVIINTDKREFVDELFLETYKQSKLGKFKYPFKGAFNIYIKKRYFELNKLLANKNVDDEAGTCVSAPTIDYSDLPLTNVHDLIFGGNHSPDEIYTLISLMKGNSLNDVAKDLNLSKMKVSMIFKSIKEYYE